MKTVRCPQCNLVCWNTVLFCTRCGFDIQSIIREEPAAEGAEQIQGFEQTAGAVFAQSPSRFYGDAPKAFSRPEEGHQSGNQGYRRQNTGFGHNRAQTFNGAYGNQYTSKSFPQKQKKGLAILSLVLGIVGMPWFMMFIAGVVAIVLSLAIGTAGLVIGFSLTVLIPAAALITGIISIKRASRSPAEYGGKGLAIGGICCSAFGLLLIPIIAAIAVPNLLAARKSANEASAISSLRTISGAETALRQTKGVACADLTVLRGEQLIDSVLARGEKTGYRFIITKLPTLKSDCAITATPTSESAGSRAFYYSTEDGVIRYRKYAGKMADMTDPPLVSNDQN